MQHHTGSVYLDAPAQASRKPVAHKGDRPRALFAGLCVTAGLVALTAAVIVTGVQLLALDTNPAGVAFETTIDDPSARAELEGEIAAAIETGLVGEELTTIAAAFELDVAAEATRIAPTILDDPTVRDELLLLADDLHARVLIEHDPADLDLTALSTAVVAVIDRESPRLADLIPADTTLWTVSGDSVPDLTRITDMTDRRPMVAAASMLLILLALVVHPRRHRVVSWLGGWTLVIGLLSALSAIGLPYLGGELSGLVAVEIAIRSISLKLLAPAAIAGIVGIGLVSFAAMLRHRDERRVSEEGAAAALGYHEPPLWEQPGTPTLDLSSRGLVDVNHPLTNI